MAMTKEKYRQRFKANVGEMRTKTEIAENVKRLALSLRVDHPIFSDETSQRVAKELIESTEGWRPSSEPPEPRMVIVGRDCLGFVHYTDDMHPWVEEWKQVLF